MGKEELALLTFLREKFSRGVLFVQTRPGRPETRGRRGGGASDPSLLPRSSSFQSAELLSRPKRRQMATQ